MQSIDTLDVCRLEDLPVGGHVRVSLSDGLELAVFNIDGELHAMDNLCPHRGAPLSEGDLCGHIIECGLHGWQFDLRSGECLTVTERLRTYEVRVDEGMVKIVFSASLR